MENSKESVGVNWINYYVNMDCMGTYYHDILVTCSCPIGYTGKRKEVKEIGRNTN